MSGRDGSGKDEPVQDEPVQAGEEVEVEEATLEEIAERAMEVLSGGVAPQGLGTMLLHSMAALFGPPEQAARHHAMAVHAAGPLAMQQARRLTEERRLTVEADDPTTLIGRLELERVPNMSATRSALVGVVAAPVVVLGVEVKGAVPMYLDVGMKGMIPLCHARRQSRSQYALAFYTEARDGDEVSLTVRHDAHPGPITATLLYTEIDKPKREQP